MEGIEDIRTLRPPMIKKLILRTIPALARTRGRELMPGTLHSLYRTLRAAFGRLCEDGVIDQNPCRVRARDLPEVDHQWRKTAFLKLHEAVQVMSDPQIPAHRRHLYTGLLCTGMRHSELAALNVGDWDREKRPLTMLPVKKAFVRFDHGCRVRSSTKTGIHREVPVMVFLERRLHAWLDHGFRDIFGRAPTFADPLFPAIVPGRPSNTPKPMEPRRWSVSVAYHAWLRDQDALGIPRRRLHDLRRTWRTLASSADVGEEFRDAVTHAAPKESRLLYDSKEWEKLCLQVMKLRFDVPMQLTLRLT